MLYLAADHAGYKMKDFLARKLESAGIVYEDLGTFSDTAVDYPSIANRLTSLVIKNKGRGVLVCGSGQGMAIAANRFKSARAAVVWNVELARETREDNDANIISLPARHIDLATAWEVVRTFLSTSFSGEERHKRRVEQLDA